MSVTLLERTPIDPTHRAAVRARAHIPSTTARAALGFAIAMLVLAGVLGLSMIAVPSVGLALMAASMLALASVSGTFAAFRSCL